MIAAESQWKKRKWIPFEANDEYLAHLLSFRRRGRYLTQITWILIDRSTCINGWNFRFQLGVNEDLMTGVLRSGVICWCYVYPLKTLNISRTYEAMKDLKLSIPFFYKKPWIGPWLLSVTRIWRKWDPFTRCNLRIDCYANVNELSLPVSKNWKLIGVFQHKLLLDDPGIGCQAAVYTADLTNLWTVEREAKNNYRHLLSHMSNIGETGRAGALLARAQGKTKGKRNLSTKRAPALLGQWLKRKARVQRRMRATVCNVWEPNRYISFVSPRPLYRIKSGLTKARKRERKYAVQCHGTVASVIQNICVYVFVLVCVFACVCKCVFLAPICLQVSETRFHFNRFHPVHSRPSGNNNLMSMYKSRNEIDGKKRE